MRTTKTALALALMLLAGACTGNRLHSAGGRVTIQTPGGEPVSTAEPSAPQSAALPGASAVPTTPGTGGKSGTPTKTPKGFQAPPSVVPVANIWSKSEDTIGITSNSIGICMHAAFLLGPAFDNKPEDEKIYWQMVNDNAGPYKGINGRKVAMSFQDDQYTPAGAKAAIDNCAATNPFFIMAGVGFDQTPTARQEAENLKIPYFYSMATRQGPDGKPYTGNVAYTSIPGVEQVGTAVGQRVAHKFPAVNIGVVWVNSPNWKAGRDSFRAEIKKLGLDSHVKTDVSISDNNQADFATVIKALKDADCKIVYLHMNALAFSRFVSQSDGQLYHPSLIGEDGFNLVTDTSGKSLRNFPSTEMVWVTPAYPDTGNAPWSAEMKRMKDAYVKYGNTKKVNDVDWMFWLAFKATHQFLLDCGTTCTRNKMAGLLLSGYKRTVDPGCGVDFSLGGGRFGGYRFNLFETVKVGTGTDATSVFHQSKTCVTGF